MHNHGAQRGISVTALGDILLDDDFFEDADWSAAILAAFCGLAPTMKKLANVHPGEILLKDFFEPMGITQNALARVIDVPPRRVNEIVLGKRSITADAALRFARAFGTSEQFWMGLQTDYDFEEARNVVDVNHIQPISA